MAVAAFFSLIAAESFALVFVRTFSAIEAAFVADAEAVVAVALAASAAACAFAICAAVAPFVFLRPSATVASLTALVSAATATFCAVAALFDVSVMVAFGFLGYVRLRCPVCLRL